MSLRKIGCFDSHTWVKIVAIWQLVSGIIFVITLSMLIHAVRLHVPYDEVFHQAFVEGKSWDVELKAHAHFRAQLIAIVSILLICKIVSLAMAPGLLYGVNNRRPMLLKMWIIYATVQFVIWTLLALTSIALQLSGTFLWVFISIPILLFAIWVVNLHKNEMLNMVLE